jgi:ribosomal protein L21E
MAKQNDKAWFHKQQAKTHAQTKMGIVMGEFKEGNLHSGKSGKIVKNRKQAIAIGLSYGKKGK